MLRLSGMPNHSLYGVVIRQTLGVVTLGIAAGVLATLVLGVLVEHYWPQFLVVIDNEVLLRTTAGTLLITAVAALVPV